MEIKCGSRFSDQQRLESWLPYFVFIKIFWYNIYKLKNTFQGGEVMVKTYAENVCTMLRRKGLAPKYEHPGIYCIKVNS